jgi:hypothetical protein
VLAATATAIIIILSPETGRVTLATTIQDVVWIAIAIGAIVALHIEKEAGAEAEREIMAGAAGAKEEAPQTIAMIRDDETFV